MTGQVYVNGEFVPADQAAISVFDHGLLYGDGVFEGLRSYNSRVFRLDEHLDRLYESAGSIMLRVPLDFEQLRDVVIETCERNGLPDNYIRLIVTRGVGDLGLDPFKCRRPSVIVIVDKIMLFPPEVFEQGMKVVTVATRRINTDALSPRIKSLNYLNNVLAKIEANHLGYPEVLMQNADGYVVEGTGDNVFAVCGDRVITPPPSDGVLKGITRDLVLELAAEAGLRPREEHLTRHDLFVADEVFLTGTAAEIVPVVEVDGRPIGAGTPGPVTTRLTRDYRQLVLSEGVPFGAAREAVV